VTREPEKGADGEGEDSVRLARGREYTSAGKHKSEATQPQQQAAEHPHAIRILLDLDELTFIDAAGLSVLVAAWHRSITDSNRLQVTPGRGNVASMFRLTGLDLVLPFRPPGPARAQSKEQNP
jgi:anti-anti-sigma factor